MLGGEDGGTTPGGVDVEPDVVSFADGSDFGKGVLRAEDGSSRCAVNVEGGVAFPFGLFDLR